MSAVLLDVNALIALAWPQHVHHAAAHRWFASKSRGAWATCAITQLAFVRISSNPKIIPEAVAPRSAHAVLRELIQLPGHAYWEALPAPAACATLQAVSMVEHLQVTDAYLLDLARHHAGRLVTLDKGLLALAAAVDKKLAARAVMIAWRRRVRKCVPAFRAYPNENSRHPVTSHPSRL